MSDGRSHDRFHGRVRGSQRACNHPGCTEPGEFRAPNPYGRSTGPNGPGDYQWLCLDHIREFNARYDFFAGMSREEIEDAQMPAAGWANANRVVDADSVDRPPKWADFHDPLEAISARFRDGVRRAKAPDNRFTPEDHRALKQLGLDDQADLKALRRRYSELVRKYHPDRNGGDRSFEKKLQAVVEAYQLLRVLPAFAT
jgi:DnaJ-domain-containing protein 1